MTGEEKRAWDSVVEDAQFNYHATGCLEEKAILSAAAELNELHKLVQIWVPIEIQRKVLGDA